MVKYRHKIFPGLYKLYNKKKAKSKIITVFS